METDLFFARQKDSTMLAIDNALADILSNYKGLTYEITPDTPQRTLLTVWNECAPGSYLKIEILNNEGTPVACVLEKVNVGRRSMVRFMNRLMDAL